MNSKFSVICGAKFLASLLIATFSIASAANPSLPSAPQAPSAQAPSGLATSDWSGIREAHEAWKHEFREVDGIWQAHNPGQQWLSLFDGRGFVATPKAASWTWGLQLESYGFADRQQAVTGTPEIKGVGQRLSYHWKGGLEEWFVNDQRGLEHGFIVSQRPAGASSEGPLTFTLSTLGNLQPNLSGDRQTVHFRDEAGAPVLNYSGLKVWDADGIILNSRFEPGTGQEFRIVVEEKGARYPITVDPIAQQAYLKASNNGSGITTSEFGSSISVSGDTVVVGAPKEDSGSTGINGTPNENASDSGAAYVFVRSGTTWTQQAYLKASNTGAQDSFGTSVSVSGDTIVVGATGEDSSTTGVNSMPNESATLAGAAYVFVRSGTIWTQQAYLKASNTGIGALFGTSVSVSGDTVVVGAIGESSSTTGVNSTPNQNASGSGAAFIFVRSGTTWTQQAYLKASNTGADDQFGSSVSVSSDTVVVGARFEGSSTTGVNSTSNNSALNSGAAYVFVRSGTTWSQQAYLKASNTGAGDYFGSSVAASGDTIVVGAPLEDSSTTGVNSTSNNSALNSGAAYVFVRSGTAWSQQAYLKSSNTGADDNFGYSVAISGDTVVIGAQLEDSNSTGVNNTPNESAINSGAAYVFVRSGTTWTQQAYLKASNTGVTDRLGSCVAISGDTVVTGAIGEDSNTNGVNSTPNESASNSGASYVFVRSGTTWSQQAYLKASNTPTGFRGSNDYFGTSVAISGDTIVVGANGEDSDTTGVNSVFNESATSSGAAYVFVRSGGAWTQQAYLKASNTGANDNFGHSVAVSGDTIVVGAIWEDSNTTGVNSTPNESASDSGAAYVFVRNGTNWSQQAYLKASNTGAGDNFGYSVAVAGDTIVVGANQEDSDTTGINSTPNDSAVPSGAAYVFVRSGTNWSQQAYLKASNTENYDQFGCSVAISGDTLVVGAFAEDSGTSGVNSTPDEGASASGAAYVYVRNGTTWSQQAYLKASNTGDLDYFGHSVAVSGDTIVVGAPLEGSSSSGVNSTPDESAIRSGAAYVFARSGTTWSQQAYLKASNTGTEDQFGYAVAIFGKTVVVGAPYEDSGTTGVNSTPDESASDAGAAYVFVRGGSTWSQQAYLKASNAWAHSIFSSSVAVSGDTVLVGARYESSSSAGVNYAPEIGGSSAFQSGAAYIFTGFAPPASSDASLASLTVGQGTLTPAFDPGVFEYTVTLPGLTETLSFSATAADPAAIITAPTSPVSLSVSEGTRFISLTVTAEDGVTTQTYGIRVVLQQDLTAHFATAAQVPLTSSGSFFAMDYTWSQGSLGFVPSPGTVLTLVNNTGTDEIIGTFTNLPQGGIAILSHGGVDYLFTANYAGGTGNDLTLSLTGSQPQYQWGVLAGPLGGPGYDDGMGNQARFYGPQGIARDAAGNLYVADTLNHTIRRIKPNGEVSTYAGVAGMFGNRDSVAGVPQFSSPGGVAVDAAGNIYVADSGNHSIRKITPARVVTTLAGLSGMSGSDDGTGQYARFNAPTGLAVDANGNIFVADTNNHTIRKITTDGVVTTLAGLPTSLGSANGTGSEARFRYPTGLVVDSAGYVFVADSQNNAIRKISPSGQVSTLATGFDSPSGVALDGSGNLCVADRYNHMIRKVTSEGMVSTLAGSPYPYGIADGTGSAARFLSPFGVVVDASGNIFVTDSESHTIRKVTPSGVVTTFAGAANFPDVVDGTGNAAFFNYPDSVAADAFGNAFVAESATHTIRKITPTGVVTTLAGVANAQGSQDGTGSEARFRSPSGLATDNQGNVFVADRNNYTIRKITPLGVVTTVAGLAGSSAHVDGAAGAARFVEPKGLAVDGAGNLYVGDNRTIRKITPDGIVSTLAGAPGVSGSANGTGSEARFNSTNGLAVDSNGNLYVADMMNHVIRKVTPEGVVSTYAGLAGNPNSSDGTSGVARFNGPFSVAVDAMGNVLVADTFNHTIRRISPAGLVTTIGGLQGSIGSSQGGYARLCMLNYPTGIASTPSGRVYVADNNNNRIVTGAPPASTPNVTSPTSADITLASATLGGNVVSDGGSPITARGLVLADVWRTPEIGGPGSFTVPATGTTGVFTANVTGLMSNTGYAFRAYATNAQGTSYSPVAYFYTLASSNARLSSLSLQQGTLTPDFHPDTLSYSAVVPDWASFVNFSPMFEDPTATATIMGVSASNPVYLAPAPSSVSIPILVTAQDGLTTRTYTVQVTRQTSFSNWASSQGATDPQADPDGDGVSNLLEYAFGLNPQAATATENLPRSETATVGADTFVALRFTRPKSAGGVTYVVEFSSDPAMTSVTTVGATTVTDNGDGTETITVRDLTALNPANPARFTRVRVIQN